MLAVISEEVVGSLLRVWFKANNICVVGVLQVICSILAVVGFRVFQQYST